MGLPGPHLIHGGAVHPFEHVSARCAEVEAGAVTMDALPAKVAELVALMRREREARSQNDERVRKDNADRPMHRI